MTQAIKIARPPGGSSGFSASPPLAISDRAIRRAETAFVALVWLATTLFALGFIARYGSNFPRNDDYGLIREIEQSFRVSNPGWLWAQTNDHRQPIGRLLQGGVWTLFPGNLRAAMFFGACCISLGAAALIGLTAATRGAVRMTDAVYPLLLLHLGHAATILFFFLAAQALCTVLQLVACSCLVTAAVTRRPWAIWGTLGLTAIGPLVGSQGVAMTPALVLGVAALWWSFPDRRRWRIPFGLAVLLAGLIVVAFFMGHAFTNPTYSEQAPLIAKIIKTLEFWSCAFGPVARRAPALAMLVTPALLLVAGIGLLNEVRHNRLNAAQALAALLAVGAALATGAAVGLFRPEPGLPDYYCLSAVVGVATIYHVLAAARTGSLSTLAQLVTFFLAAAGFCFHATHGMQFAQARQTIDREFLDDVRQGIPLSGLVGKHRYSFAMISVTEDWFRDDLLSLRELNLPVYADIVLDPELVSRPLTADQVAVYGAVKSGTAWKRTESQVVVQLRMPQPTRITALRCTYQAETTAQVADWKCFALRGDCVPALGSVPIQTGRFAYHKAKPTFPREQTIWVDDTVDSLVFVFERSPEVFEFGGFQILEPPIDSGLASGSAAN